MRLATPARWALLISVIALLIYELARIGWRNVLGNLPATPWFYVILLVNYCSMPLFETVIYNMLWKTGRGVLPELIKKRVYNEAVLDYSGEPALFLWATTHTRIQERQIASNIRDVNVLSALAGNLITCVVLLAVVVLQADQIGANDAVLLRRGALFAGASVLVLAALAMVFRKWLLALSLGQCAATGSLHIARLLASLALLALQWHVALPMIGWPVWVTFLALQMAVSRLPLLPAKDLVFAGLAISLGERMALAPGVIAGLFVAQSGLIVIVHASMYLLAYLFAPKALAPEQA